LSHLHGNLGIKTYGFAEEELDFITNYDIKYHVAKELSGKE